MTLVPVNASDTAKSLLAGIEQAATAVVMIDASNDVIHFNAATLPGLIFDILAENSLSPDRLMLEVTESVVMCEHAIAVETMTKIRAAGIWPSMDDFGTGYSSLSQLAYLPVRELKIDRSFMRGIESEPSALAIATAVVHVGKGLGMTVVAEGVETVGQHKIMADLGCDVIQGFLYSPALSPFDFEKWTVARNAERLTALVVQRRAAANLEKTEVQTNARANGGVR